MLSQKMSLIYQFINFSMLFINNLISFRHGTKSRYFFPLKKTPQNSHRFIIFGKMSIYLFSIKGAKREYRPFWLYLNANDMTKKPAIKLTNKD